MKSMYLQFKWKKREMCCTQAVRHCEITIWCARHNFSDQSVLCPLFPGGYQVNSEGEDQGRAGHGSHPPRDWDHVIPPPPTHHLYIWRWGFAECLEFIWQIIHTRMHWTHININTHVQDPPLPRLIQHLWPSCGIVVLWHADVIIRPGLQLWDVIHLLCSVWASKSLDGSDGVHLDLSECVCVEHLCVCVRGVVF